jgi:hypothetical protein
MVQGRGGAASRRMWPGRLSHNGVGGLTLVGVAVELVLDATPGIARLCRRAGPVVLFRILGSPEVRGVRGRARDRRAVLRTLASTCCPAVSSWAASPCAAARSPGPIRWAATGRARSASASPTPAVMLGTVRSACAPLGTPGGCTGCGRRRLMRLDGRQPQAKPDWLTQKSSSAQVSGPMMPSAAMWTQRWNSCVSALVRVPNLPSTLRGSPSSRA